MTLEELIERTNYSLASEGLTLSVFGKEEIAKRWKKKEAEGGYSQALKDSEYENTNDKSYPQIWEASKGKRAKGL